MKFKRFLAALAAVLIIGGVFTFASASHRVPKESDSVRVSEKMKAESMNTVIGKLDYRIYYSPSFNPTDHQTPAVLIVYLHNIGGRGSDNVSHLAERGFLNQLVSDDSDTLFKEHPYVVVAPQCPVGRTFADADMVEAVEQLREELVFSKGAFTEKCIIMGIGSGANGVFEYISTYTGNVDRAVTVGGSPDKEKVTGAVSSGVSLLAFAQADNASFNEFYDYAERVGEASYITPVSVDGNLAACVDAALKYNDPSVAFWCINDYMTSRVFKISARCDENGGKISVSPASVKYGGNASVLLTLNKGYAISRVLVDGNDVSVALFEQTATNKNQYTYTFVGVTENHSIMVELESIPEDGAMADFISALMKGLSIAFAVCIVSAVAVLAVDALKKKTNLR